MPARRRLVYAMFLIIAAAALWVPLYNRVEPTFGGIPFFYWFQLFLIVVTAFAAALAYRLKV